MKPERISESMLYVSPGAGAVALACNHGVRYPDICTECSDRANTDTIEAAHDL